MADRVSVVARFQVQADKIDAFIEAAQRTMVEPTQGEKGCIRYQLWQDLEDPTKSAFQSAHALLQNIATVRVTLHPRCNSTPRPYSSQIGLLRLNCVQLEVFSCIAQMKTKGRSTFYLYLD